MVIGNESEAEAWADASGQPDKDDLQAIARAIALTSKANPSRPRTVIITQGAGSTTVVTAGENITPKIYPVQALPEDAIVDTNGAGDAFAGGVLAALVSGKSIDETIEIGHKMGAMCVQLVSNKYFFIVRCILTSFTTRLVHNSSGRRSSLCKLTIKDWEPNMLSTAFALNSARI